MTDNPSAVRRWRVFPPHVDEVVAASAHDATVSALQRELATERARFANLSPIAAELIAMLWQEPISFRGCSGLAASKLRQVLDAVAAMKERG